MDTPAVPAPRDAREAAVLERLTVIRDQLLLLKRDRTTYIRSQDVIPLYDQTVEQVRELKTIRAETGSKEENRGATVFYNPSGLISGLWTNTISLDSR